MENKKHYWPDEVRLKMIEKSEFYSDPKLYQFGFYDGYHSLTRELSELREENERLKEGLKPFEALAHAVLDNDDFKGNRTLYAFDRAEITYDDLRKVIDILQSKKP